MLDCPSYHNKPLARSFKFLVSLLLRLVFSAYLLVIRRPLRLDHNKDLKISCSYSLVSIIFFRRAINTLAIFILLKLGLLYSMPQKTGCFVNQVFSQCPSLVFENKERYSEFGRQKNDVKC